MRALTLTEARELKSKVIELLKTVFDPEIPVNIYELGMVYNTSVDLAGAVDITMTLTSPACPVAGSLPGEVQNKVASVPGVASARVNLVWTPPWTKDMMSDAAKLKLNLL
ncbi:MAG: SUF system Fe-S cluster assembly protein [Planctomycetes bacterium]|nr:SUF system Fe-S cluster assembly protein [Planctomycetota bacterium]